MSAKKAEPGDDARVEVSLAGHPRVAIAVRRAKGWGGLVGLALVGFLALNAGAPPFEVMLRALAGGLAGYVALWAVGVAVGRQLVIAEVRAHHERLREAVEARAAAAEAAKAERRAAEVA